MKITLTAKETKQLKECELTLRGNQIEIASLTRQRVLLDSKIASVLQEEDINTSKFKETLDTIAKKRGADINVDKWSLDLEKSTLERVD